jgi:pimeloyl-ACP methyl ester carboxylesterase
MPSPLKIEERDRVVCGVPTRFLVAGDGPPMLLLHGDGDNRLDWRWTVPHLAGRYRVYAPDLPGFGGGGMPPDCSPEFFGRFTREFLDAVCLEPAVVVGNSLGGLVALRLALHTPDRVRALGLIGGAGLGREVNLLLRQLTLRGVGEAAVRWGRTRVGAAHRAVQRIPLLFANPAAVPAAWIVEQYRLARLPGFLETTLAALRGQVDRHGQKQILLDDMAHLAMPTLLIWGRRDRIVPIHQAFTASRLIPNATLHVIRKAGHVPHIERPEQVAVALFSITPACPAPPVHRCNRGLSDRDQEGAGA